MKLLTCQRDGNFCLVRYQGIPFYIREPKDLKHFVRVLGEQDARLYHDVIRTQEYQRLAEGAGSTKAGRSLEATRKGAGVRFPFTSWKSTGWVLAVEGFIKSLVRQTQVTAG